MLSPGFARGCPGFGGLSSKCESNSTIEYVVFQEMETSYVLCIFLNLINFHMPFNPDAEVLTVVSISVTLI